ncbi:GNAT family N-acetyltransferase [Terriglobus saanensis]|uniref:GCN5-related N-acetyltransferase n=1 Tax=Terriglobus saanensis (strain ATCC BAA-1853 / DSM 23119 / SP1PR4) TaxID=401053 RepID=E8V4I4_TERSS|nr:N-acetyltransferase [Terriglobus saanensis]ADV84808.1 GCN5-related N-acetyltransferase [Terriglobus saanensis SP1PR4]
MSIEIQYRPGTPGDLSAVNAVEEACFQPPLRFSKGLLRRMLRDDLSLVALSSKEIAGFVIASLETENSQRFGYIATLEVLSAYRRHGVARHLLMTAEDLLRNEGCRYVALHVAMNNVAAMALYASCGYESVGTVEKFYPNGTDAALMVHLL